MLRTSPDALESGVHGTLRPLLWLSGAMLFKHWRSRFLFNLCYLSSEEHCQADSDSDDLAQDFVLYLAAAIVLVRFCSASALASSLRGEIIRANASNQYLVNVKFVDRHYFRSYDEQWHEQVRKDPD